MERQLQLKTQQQFTKEYMEAKGLKEEQEAGQSQGPGPGPGSTTSAPGPLTTSGALVHTSSDTDEEANKEGEQEEQPGEEGEEVKLSVIYYLVIISLYYLCLYETCCFILIFFFFQEEEYDEEEHSEEEADDEEENYPKLPQVGTILSLRDGPQQPPLPPSPQAQPQPPPPPLQTAFVPIQPLPDYNSAGYPGNTSPELQRVLVGQQMLGQQQQGQQLAGLGPGMIPQQTPDGLMVATPAQTLTDTLDDIMAGRCILLFCS